MPESDSDGRPAAVFVGSSSEGAALARAIATAIDKHPGIESTVWDEGVFRPSSYSLDSLIGRAHRADFAILVATPDDTVHSRGAVNSTVRDNVLIEYGLFVGVLGRERVFLLAPGGDLHLPSDLGGLTYLPYKMREDGNLSAAVRGAADAVVAQIRDQGLRHQHRPLRDSSASEEGRLQRELDIIADNARAQGWRVKTNDRGTLRLLPVRASRPLTFSYDPGRPHEARVQLRDFASWLQGSGLRLHNTVRRPVAS